MTQEEITKEYGQLAGALGERVYRFFVPVLEMHQMMSRLMHLNHEAWKIKEAEKKTENNAASMLAGLESAPGNIGTDVK